jgi:hypothetical protein
MNKKQIHSTTNYSQFKNVEGNREINPRHVAKLVKAITEKDLQIPILVDQNMRVVDGQHRLEAYKELNNAVTFIIKKDFDIKDIRKLNSVSKNWTLKQYLYSFKDLKLESYVHLEWFHRHYKFGIAESLHMLCGVFSSTVLANYKNGKFVIKDLERGKLWAERINFLKDYFVHYKKVSFIRAMINAFKHEEFDWNRFEQKLENFSSLLKNQGSAADFLINIEKLYNHKTPTNKKIRFNVYEEKL